MTSVVVMTLAIYFRALYPGSAFVCNMELRFILPAMMLTVISFAGCFSKGNFMENGLMKAFISYLTVFSFLSCYMWFAVLAITDYDAIKFVMW